MRASAAPRPKENWFTRLPPDQREELDAVRKAWQAGELAGSARAVARSLVEHCGRFGIEVCGTAGVREWLARRD